MKKEFKDLLRKHGAKKKFKRALEDQNGAFTLGFFLDQAEKAHGADEVIAFAFDWSNTLEGDTFWYEIDQAWRKVCEENKWGYYAPKEEDKVSLHKAYTLRKLELEKVYEEYTKPEIESAKGMQNQYNGDPSEFERIGDLMELFAQFRLHVSGGAQFSMGSVGMETPEGFVAEIDLFDDMMSDWAGCYRGDFQSECQQELFRLLDEHVTDPVYGKHVKDAYMKQHPNE